MEKATMTVTEFARLEGISRPTAYNWIKQDGFPIIRIGEKSGFPSKVTNSGLTTRYEREMLDVGVLRHHHQTDYTVVPNTLIRDDALSCRSIGLLCKLLSLPEGWEFSVRGVCTLCPREGRDAVTKSLRELESARHLRREGQSRRVRGTFAGADWVVSDVPLPMPEKPMTDLPSSVNP